MGRSRGLAHTDVAVQAWAGGGIFQSAELIEHHASGRVRILVTGGAQRSPALPDVPTFREGGTDIDATG